MTWIDRKHVDVDHINYFRKDPLHDRYKVLRIFIKGISINTLFRFVNLVLSPHLLFSHSVEGRSKAADNKKYSIFTVKDRNNMVARWSNESW